MSSDWLTVWLPRLTLDAWLILTLTLGRWRRWRRSRAVILVLIFVVYIVLELSNWKRVNRRLARQQPRWWWKWWQRPSYPSPTTDQGVERQFWHALGCGLLICAICVACGCGPLVLVLLSAYL